MVETMITVDEALDRIFTRIPTPLPETVPLNRAHKRVLLTPLLAKHTQPPFDASAMDGYAVRAAEIEPGKPVFLAGTSQAGARFTGMMQSGECVRIFTGAPLPIGADAVIMQEQATGAILDYEVPGLAEAMRASGRAITPMADLSRGLVGVRGQALIVNVPGSPKAALESLAAIEAVLDHALETLAGPFDHGAGGAT
jgi:molybdopterin molybdotransferase